METNLAYGPGCALTWLPVNLAARELGLWSQCCEFLGGPAWQCKLLVDMARGSVLWLQLSGCGLWTQLGFVDLVQEPSLGLWIWLMSLAWDLDLVVDSRLWTCLPPCHVNVAACGPCLRARAWLLVDPESATMGLWTWLLMGLASPCRGLAYRSSCYLRTCLAPATASKLPEKFWISTRGLGKFRMWLDASGPGRSCRFDQAACLTAQ